MRSRSAATDRETSNIVIELIGDRAPLHADAYAGN